MTCFPGYCRPTASGDSVRKQVDGLLIAYWANSHDPGADLAITVWAYFHESLGWWAGWFGDKIYDLNHLTKHGGQPPQKRDLSPAWVQYPANRLATVKRIFSNGSRGNAETVIVDDLFPYSVNNLRSPPNPIWAGFGVGHCIIS